MKVKSGFYIVSLRSGQEYRIKAISYTEAVNKVIDEKKEDLKNIIDANPEYIDR